MNFRNLIAAFALLITLVAVIATSSPRSSLDSGSFNVQSDCVSPALNQNITVADDAITAPPATSFTDFGFPLTTVNLGVEQSGTVGAVQRTCSPTYGSTDDDAEAWIFSCYDNGVAVCSILIKKQ